MPPLLIEMTNWLQHPGIYKVSIALATINALVLCLAIWNGATEAIVINVVFFVINLLAAIGNYRLRDYRISQATAQANERRQRLIDLTVGAE